MPAKTQKPKTAKAARRTKPSAPPPPAVPAAAPPVVPAPAEVVTRDTERGSYDGDTAIKLYLREIGLVKLLTPQEEIELAARIKKGDKKAREHMIKANLRLVVRSPATTKASACRFWI